MADTAASTRIFLLRHARASWAAPGMADFDRPLDAEGREDAGRIGRAMGVNGFVPQRVLCSPARRCVETFEIVARQIDMADPVMIEALYAEDHHVYIDLIRDQSDADSVLVVGHNPMMESTVKGLMTWRTDSENEILLRGFPAAGLAVVEVDGPLARAALAPTRLAAFLTPQDI